MTKLDYLLSCFQGEHVYIQTHNFPDPDAIASAYGLSSLLTQKGMASTIFYGGSVDRYNTLKMIDLLEIPIRSNKQIPNLTSEDEVILIDAQAGNANIGQTNNCRLYCIDHHPIYEQSHYLFSDIRPAIGSCASMIAQYFFENNIPLTTKVATALIYGLKIDTANLTRGVAELDLNMFYQLYITCDHTVLQSLDNNTLQLQDLRAYASAIHSITIIKDTSFANAGPDCQEALIATISDFLIALATIHLSIVYSIKKDGIKISVRSVVPYYDSGKICNLALSGIGSGGGHASMAGGFVPFSKNESYNKNLSLELIPRFTQAVKTLYTS